MRGFAWALLVLMSGDVLPPLLLAGDPGGRAQYIGGTVAALPSKSEGRLNITDEEALLFRTKQASVRIPYRQINTLEYGQRVNRRYVEAVLAGGGVAPHFVDATCLSPLVELDRLLAQQDEPFYAPNLFLHDAIHRAAAASGMRLVLDGLDGDTTVSHGLGYLHELVRRGRWVQLARHIKALGARLGRPVAPIWRGQVLAPFLPSMAHRAWASVRGRRAPGGVPFVRADFARRIQLAGRAAADRARWCVPWLTERQEHHCRLTTGLIPFVLEVADRSAAACGVEARYPFFDKRLAELCLAFPPGQKLRDGWTRFVLRRAMQDILPSDVTWRAGKADLGPNFTRRLGGPLPPELAAAVLDRGAMIREYVDGAAFEALLPTPRGEAPPPDPMSAWRLVSLGRWLETNAQGSPITGGSRHEDEVSGPRDSGRARPPAHASPVCEP